MWFCKNVLLIGSARLGCRLSTFVLWHLKMYIYCD